MVSAGARAQWKEPGGARRRVGQMLLLLKRYAELEADYQRVLAVRPNDLTALHGLAEVLLARKDWSLRCGFISAC